MDIVTNTKRLEPNSALFFFLITLAAIFDVTFGFLPVAGVLFTFLFNTIVGIQLMLANYGAGVMRLVFAQVVLLTLEMLFAPLPSSMGYLLVHNLFNYLKHATEKRSAEKQSEQNDSDEYLVDVA